MYSWQKMFHYHPLLVCPTSASHPLCSLVSLEHASRIDVLFWVLHSNETDLPTVHWECFCLLVELFGFGECHCMKTMLRGTVPSCITNELYGTALSSSYYKKS